MRLYTRKWEILVALLAALLVFGLNFKIKGPAIQPDEAGYLTNASALAGFENDLSNSYHAGYSLLIAPAFLIADSPENVWAVVKAINAVLFFVTVYCLSVMAKILRPEINYRDRLAGVAIVSIYPMWVVMAGYSFSENAYVPFFLLICIVYHRCLSEWTRTFPWFVLALLAGFLYWIHPKAIPVLFAITVGTAYISIQRRSYFQLVILVSGIFFMIYSYQNGLAPWLQEHMTSSGEAPNLHYPRPEKLLSAFLTLEGLRIVLAHVGGHLFYLSLGSLGLFWVGIFSLFNKIRFNSLERANDLIKHRAIAIFLGLTLSGTFATSVLLFSVTPEAARLDNWIYGRYVEGVIAPLLLLGAFSPTFRKGLWAVVVAVISAVLLNFGITEYTHTAPFNVSAFWQEFYLREQGLWVWLWAGCGLIILTSIVPRRAAILLIGLVFSFSVFLQVEWHGLHSKVANRRLEVANFIRANYPPGTCVGFSHEGINNNYKHVFWFDFGVVLFDYRLKRTSFEKWLENCTGPLISYEMNLEEGGEVYPIAISPLGGPTVWEKGHPPSTVEYPITVADRSVRLLRMLGDGWHFFEEEIVWSGRMAKLKLPVPDQCRPGQCKAVLTLSVFGASKNRAVSVFFKDNRPGSDAFPTLIARSPAMQIVNIPLPGSVSSYDLVLEVPQAISPSELWGNPDKRVLGIALRSVNLFNPEEVYPIVVADQSVGLSNILGEGWHPFDRDVVWSTQKAELKLPVPDLCRSERCNVALVLSVFGASEERPVKVLFKPGQSDPEAFLTTFVSKGGNVQRVFFPLPADHSQYSFWIEVPKAASPHDLFGSLDNRILGVALHSIELNRIQ